MGWNTQAVISGLVIIEGPGDGEFIYDAAGNLRAANVGQATTDPVQGITCYQGFQTFNGHGALIELMATALDAHFYYADTGTSSQGALIFSDVVASGGATDPFGNVAQQGRFAYGTGAALGFGVLNTAVGTNPRWYVDRSDGSHHWGPGTGITDTVLFRSNIGVVGIRNSLAIQNNLTIGNLTYLSPSGDATGVTDTAALNILSVAGSSVVLTTGTWYLNCNNGTLTGLSTGQYIRCEPGVTINALGSGDLFYWSNSSASSTQKGGLLGHPIIDGNGTTGSATAIHAGDITDLEFEAVIKRWRSGTVSWGMLLDNQNFFTEHTRLDLDISNCGVSPGNGGCLGFNVGGASTSTESFARLYGRVNISPGTNQRDGVVLMNGARIYDSPFFSVGGNFGSAGAATTAAFLRITGQVPAGHPGAGDYSKIENSALYFQAEIDNAGANPPITIVFNSGGNNYIRGCAGLIDFSSGAGTFTKVTNFNESFEFDGPVFGDLDLMRAQHIGMVPFQEGDPPNGAILGAGSNGLVRCIPTAARTGLILAVGNFSGDAFRAPRKVTVMNTAAFASGFDLTFATAATSHVSGGTAVTIPAGTALTFQWSADDGLWYPEEALPAVISGSSHPSNPVGTTSTTNVMMGLGAAGTPWAFTPASSGKMMLVATGLFEQDTNNAGVTFGARYGTGTAPANGVADTGTAWGGGSDYTLQNWSAGASGKTPFTFSDVISLTAGTAYWLDLALSTANAADKANVFDCCVTWTEVQ